MPTRLGDHRTRPSRRHCLCAWLRGVALSALICSGVSAFAEESPADLQRAVKRHVAELSSSLRSERTRAEQSLLELGPQILDLLPSTEEITDQATRVAVRQLRIKLERVAAEQSVLPSRVSFQGRATVAELAGQITKQTGNPLDAGGLPADVRTREVDVAFNDAPFWECLATLARLAGVEWRPATDAAGLQLVAETTDSVTRAVQIKSDGAFRVSLDSLTRQRGTIRASLELEAEPRLRPLFIRIADADFSATAAGSELALFNPRAVTELPMTSRNAARFSVLFRVTEDQLPQPLTLKGRVSVHVAAAPVEVRFDDLSGKRVVYLRRGGVSVTLKRSNLAAGPQGSRVLTARLAVAYDTGGPEFESHRTWIYHNDVRLESPDGTTFSAEGGFDVTQQSNGGVEVEYRFPGLPDRPLHDWQLVYVAPTLLIDVPVEFEFDNVLVSEGK